MAKGQDEETVLAGEADFAAVTVVSATVVIAVAAVDFIITTDSLTGITIVMYEAQSIVVIAIMITMIAMMTDVATITIPIQTNITVITAVTAVVTTVTCDNSDAVISATVAAHRGNRTDPLT